MVYITGDTHGDVSRLGEECPPISDLGKNDTVIICGDFGLVWSGQSRETFMLDWLAERPFTILFVDGNHENFDMLSTYPITEWNGGKVQAIRPNVLHLMRGQVFTIEGKTFFTMGGASSHDIDDGILEPDDPHFYEKKKRLDAVYGMYRVNHHSWWKEEVPSPEEMDEGRTNLAAHGWAVDYIITHCCPSSIVSIIGGGRYDTDVLTDYFDEINAKCQYKTRYFGHYHDNRHVTNKSVMIYENIERVV